MIYHINKLKNKKHMAISIEAEKPSDKLQHALMIKRKKKKSFLNTIKAIYEKLTARHSKWGKDGVISSKILNNRKMPILPTAF